MRRIVMFSRVTPEGYFAGPEGNLNWAVMDNEVDQLGAQGIQAVDTFVFGRRTYEMFAGYWSHALESGARAPHGEGSLSPEHRAMAVALNEMTKLVFSTTLREATWHNARVLRALDPRAIEALKREPGKDITVLGSGSIVSQLTQHGLIDEYRLVVNPVLLGSGRPLFSGLSRQVALQLIEARPFASGNVLLRYTPRR